MSSHITDEVKKGKENPSAREERSPQVALLFFSLYQLQGDIGLSAW
jgi:hypothetical protein